MLEQSPLDREFNIEHRVQCWSKATLAEILTLNIILNVGAKPPLAKCWGKAPLCQESNIAPTLNTMLEPLG